MNEALADAMSFADVIRKHVVDATEQGSLQAPTQEYWSLQVLQSTTPGLVAGCIMGATVFGMSVPLRSALFRRWQPAAGFDRTLADLLMTTTQLYAAGTSGLYTMSLIGSHTYLKQLASIPSTAPSPTADAICSQVPSAEYAWNDRTWDPRHATLRAYSQALASCRSRQTPVSID